METPTRNFMRAVYGLCGAALVLASAPTQATLPVADSPLFLTVAVPPNITLTLDDSGSMARAFVPDICGATTNDCSALDNRYSKSNHYNPIYYNPAVKYPAPPDAAGVARTTSFTAAYRYGFDTSTGGPGTRNLETSYRPTAYVDVPPGSTTGSEGYMDHYADDVRCSSTSTRVCEIGSSSSGWQQTSESCSGGKKATDSDRDNICKSSNAFPGPAYYYVFDAANTNCTGTNAEKAVDNDCYDLKFVTNNSGPGGTDERQNFANWYSFARTRNLATQTAAALAFVDLNPDVRVAWQALHTCFGTTAKPANLPSTTCQGWKTNFSNMSNQIGRFTGGHKTDFYAWLAQLPTNDSTPLPAAMKRVGEYYRTLGEGSPYDTDLDATATNSGELACRRNYHVMMTDGIWNNALSFAGNKDGTTVALPVAHDGVSQFTSPTYPYSDDNANTLADLSFYYWVTDLRTDLSNNLLRNYRDKTGTAVQNLWNPRNDPATWQHMVNFTIGLGLSGYLSQVGLTWDGNMYGGSYSALAAGTTTWPKPESDKPANVADLWHAAINSRGQFFSADDPVALSTAFKTALTAITEESGSSAALSANSTSLTGSTLVYQAKFNDDWSGTLLAFPVNSTDGKVVPVSKWDASTLIPKHSDRKIFTHNGTSGVEFSSCSNLSVAQRAALNTNSGGVVDNHCDARMAWLRGDPKDEVRTTTGGLKLFRNRPKTVMGDIINSDPAYVKDVNYGYTGLPAGTLGQDSYDSYRSSNASRTAMVYVGSNDGRMYAIRGDADAADSGAEKFAYIPGGVYKNLSHLTDPSYAHRYYADGSIIARDAYIGGAWKTVVVGGLNSGGKSVYALDVTNPNAFDASKVLWEFDEVDDPSGALGLTFSRPQIAVLQNGSWVAIFGNGYNSTSGGAYLYVVDLATGSLLKRITASDTTGDESNGLSTPVLFDANNDKMIDAAYAGDLQGNLWKFDLSGAVGSWGVANSQPLFTARIGSTAQPITAQPKIAAHPSGGQLILFGTGRYLTNADVFDTSRQSFYGIWDHGFTTTTTRSNLQQQTFDLQDEASGRDVRSVTDSSVDWVGGKRGWYLDLVDGTGTGTAKGERVIHTSVVAANKVIFGSVVPSIDPCTPGGESWLMVLDLTTGGAFNYTVLDVNGDGVFDQLDTPNADGTFINGVRTGELGMTNVPWLLTSDAMSPDDGTPERGYLEQSGTTGEFLSTGICLKVTGCGTSTPPPSTPGVRRRSWIQIK